jgi:hypothetical protein
VMSDSKATEWAAQPISIQGSDITGIVLTMQPTLAVSLSLESDSGPLPQGAALVFKRESPSREREAFAEPHFATLEDGKFVVKTLTPGKYLVSLQPGTPDFSRMLSQMSPEALAELKAMPEFPGAPDLSGWRLASVMFGDIDAVDLPIDVKPGEDLPGRARLTKSTTEISGRLTGSFDAALNYFVIAFAADERYWLPGNRRNAAVEIDPQGRFTFPNLPAGRYRLAVVEDFDALAGLPAVLLRQLAGMPTVDVTLTDGAKVVQDVRIK